MILIVFLSCSCFAAAQSPDWKVTIDEEIISATMSTNGNYVVLIIDQDKGNAQCVNARTGALVWTKTIEDYNSYFSGRFIGNDVYLLPNKNQYEFIKASDGTVLKTLPILGETWDDDLVYTGTRDAEYSSMVPYFFGDLGVFYFSDGFQIVDLQKREIIHESKSSISQIRYEYWNAKVMMLQEGDSDSLYVLDTASGKIDFAMEMGSSSLNSRVQQHFATTDKQMFLFCEDNILCIDFGKKEIPAIIPVDPEDPDVYLPVASKTDLYLVISDSDMQSLYKCSDGKQMWQTDAGAVPGLVDIARTYNNDKDLVLFTYQEDGKMLVNKLDMQTGKKAWSTALFQQEGSYAPGHLKESKTGAFIAAALVSVAANMMGGGRNAFGQRTFYRPNWLLLDRSLARSKSSDGYAYLLDTTNQSKLVVAMGGRIYTELKKSEHDDYDGEGFAVLDLKDGKVLEHTPGFIIAESEKEGTYNAVKFMTVASTQKADFVMGTHDVYVVSDGKIEHVAFDKEKDIVTYISSMDKEQTVNFSVNHDYDNYEYWILDASSLPVRKMICARSTVENFVFPDTAKFACLVNYNDGELAGYKFAEGPMTESRLAAPLWKMSEDEVDDLDIGGLEGNRSATDGLQGIRVIDGSVYLLGSDGIGKVSPDGKCRWSIEWDPKLIETRMMPRRVGSYFVFSTGEDTRIIHDGCNEARVVGQHEISFSDVDVVTDGSKEIIVMDKSDGVLYGYHVK